jgi:nitronate monooxygenase
MSMAAPMPATGDRMTAETSSCAPEDWPDGRVLDLLGIELPIVQSPMAGFGLADLVVAVSDAGGLGSLGCAGLPPETVRTEVAVIRQRTNKPFALNFFCHGQPDPGPDRLSPWRGRLLPYYRQYGLSEETPWPTTVLPGFDDAACDLVEELRPSVVSFHFGLPGDEQLRRLKDIGIRILSSATTVEEALWLEQQGCDAIIAQGFEAGGHSARFLIQDQRDQIGTIALVPQLVDAVRVPIIAAGGLADGRGIAAALTLGAAAVQMGTAYLLCPETKTSRLHREGVKAVAQTGTALTNVFTGRLARSGMNRVVREFGPIAPDAPPFPTAGAALLPLRAKCEPLGKQDFTPLWCGQSASLAREIPAGQLTRELAGAAALRLRSKAYKPGDGR